ncbi:MAG: secretion system protein [Phenylobacterium sp.]|nr:secretion system protein [Phenylobacterium sp.]
MAHAIVFLTAFLAVAALAAAVAALTLGDRAFNARLEANVRAADLGNAHHAIARSMAPALLRTLVNWGEKAGRGGIEDESRTVLRLKLMQAGFYSDRAVEAFFGVRAAAALGLSLLAVVVVLVFDIAGVLRIAGVIMLAANIGLFAPNLLLAMRIAERTKAMYHGLPDAIDLMVVSLEAGATLGAALQRVVIEFRELHPVLTEQFGIMLMEMQAGASRADALTRLSHRSPSDEVRSLTTMIIQSEAVGASLGDTLRVFSEDMRKTRYLDAERKAAELPVKIAFPLVFCIFPCLTGVIFIPIAIRFIRSLFS